MSVQKLFDTIFQAGDLYLGDTKGMDAALENFRFAFINTHAKYKPLGEAFTLFDEQHGKDYRQARDELLALRMLICLTIDPSIRDETHEYPIANLIYHEIRGRVNRSANRIVDRRDLSVYRGECDAVEIKAYQNWVNRFTIIEEFIEFHHGETLGLIM